MVRFLAIPARLGMASLFLSAALAAPALAEAPRVVVSIKPVHSLVSSVMKGVGKPFLIIKGGASPHSYAMRPSEARALSRAKVIFWVGEGLEQFLIKPIASLGKRAMVVELHEAKGIRLHKTREGGLWEAHDDHDDHDHEKKAAQTKHDHGKHKDKKHAHGKHKHEKHGHAKHGHGKKAAGHDDHDHGEQDMHIWLDPENAKAIVRAAAAALIKADPGNAAAYRQNAAQTLKRLTALDTEIRTALNPIRSRRYIVFHDAYQYLEKRYSLAAAGSVTVNPQRRPGAQRISVLRRRIARDKVRCVFIEPQFPPKVVQTIIAGTAAKTATLDPIGAKLPAGEDAYFVLLRNLATSLKGCLG